MSVRVRPSVNTLTIRQTALSILRTILFSLCLFSVSALQADNDILGLEILYGEGLPYWAHRLQDPQLARLQNEALLHALSTGDDARVMIELQHLRKRRPLVRSQNGRISFLSSSGDWLAFGFSALGSFARADRLPPDHAIQYYELLRRRDADFLAPAGSQERLAELLYLQKHSSLDLSPNFMLSADVWIRPERWPVQPFLRLGISAPIEENHANGLFTSSSGLRFLFGDERSLGLIVEGHADAYRVLWEDYTGFRKNAVVWDAGWRAGFFLQF